MIILMDSYSKSIYVIKNVLPFNSIQFIGDSHLNIWKIERINRSSMSQIQLSQFLSSNINAKTNYNILRNALTNQNGSKPPKNKNKLKKKTHIKSSKQGVSAAKNAFLFTWNGHIIYLMVGTVHTIVTLLRCECKRSMEHSNKN